MRRKRVEQEEKEGELEEDRGEWGRWSSQWAGTRKSASSSSEGNMAHLNTCVSARI